MTESEIEQRIIDAGNAVARAKAASVVTGDDQGYATAMRDLFAVIDEAMAAGITIDAVAEHIMGNVTPYRGPGGGRNMTAALVPKERRT